MRTRLVVPPSDQHGKALRCYDFIAKPDAKPGDIVAAAEAALGLKLQHHGDYVQHGYVYTERFKGARHVVLALYEACANEDCPAGHGALRDIDGGVDRPAIKYVRAADPTAKQLAAFVKAVGEHPVFKLTDDDETPLTTLRNLH